MSERKAAGGITPALSAGKSTRAMARSLLLTIEAAQVYAETSAVDGLVEAVVVALGTGTATTRAGGSIARRKE